jgi:hypothetical protein
VQIADRAAREAAELEVNLLFWIGYSDRGVDSDAVWDLSRLLVEP